MEEEVEQEEEVPVAVARQQVSEDGKGLKRSFILMVYL